MMLYQIHEQKESVVKLLLENSIFLHDSGQSKDCAHQIPHYSLQVPLYKDQKDRQISSAIPSTKIQMTIVNPLPRQNIHPSYQPLVANS